MVGLNDSFGSVNSLVDLRLVRTVKLFVFAWELWFVMMGPCEWFGVTRLVGLGLAGWDSFCWLLDSRGCVRMGYAVAVVCLGVGDGSFMT